jgi:di/tricarboxylate transporter
VTPGILTLVVAAGALLMAVVGILYLFTIGRWLIPERSSSNDLLESFELREYLTGLTVGPSSPLAGKTLEKARFQESFGLQVIEIEREGGRIRSPEGDVRLREGDLLLAEGKTPDVAQIAKENGLTIAGTPPDLSLEGQEETRLAEVLIPPRSRAAGRTLAKLRFRARTGTHALAIQRQGARLHRPVGEIELAPGDLLLVTGPEERLEQLHESFDFALLGAVDLPARRTRKIAPAVGILGLVVLLPALNVLPILVSALLGVIAMVVTGVMTPAEAYDEIDWMVIVLLGSILSLGFAMQETGAASFLANHLVGFTRAWGPRGTLAALYLLTSLLTGLISNNGAAVVLTPIAAATAEALGASPLPFIVAVMFAASNSFMTPVGYQTNTFIYGPGGYRFSDYLRVGAPLNLLLLATASVVIPLFFPF